MFLEGEQPEVEKIVKVGVIMNFHDAFDIDASLDKGDGRA